MRQETLTKLQDMGWPAVFVDDKLFINFSSPHPFKLDDGSTLPACSDEDAEKLKVTFIENDLGDGDISLSFSLSRQLFSSFRLMSQISKQLEKDLNVRVIVFIPLPMLTALKSRYRYEISQLKNLPFRCIRMVDRIDKVVSTTKFSL